MGDGDLLTLFLPKKPCLMVVSPHYYFFDYAPSSLPAELSPLNIGVKKKKEIGEEKIGFLSGAADLRLLFSRTLVPSS
ncbi:hypothetical protein L1887_20648 [Cichorium endivia]|nr:hypothetical protein L1887_20648 [Cichorium endivia]